MGACARCAKKEMIMLRIIANMLLCVFLFVFPPYLFLIALIVSIFLFPNFVESIFWAFLADSIYSGGKILGWNFHYMITLLVIVIFLISFRIKEIVSFY